MSKKKSPKVFFPEMEAMLEGMNELLTDEYGNPLPPEHPQVKKFKNLAEQIGNDTASPQEHEDSEPWSGHA